MKWGIRIFGLILFLYLIGLIAVFLMQRKFMYFPPAAHPGLASTGLESMTEVEIETSNGDRITSWWHPPENTESVVIFFHGNGSSVYDGRFIYEHLIAQGFGVLGAEYPGYPDSSGTPNQTSIISAAHAQYDFIAGQGVSGESIHIYGTSLGAAVASQLAATRKTGKLVLEAPFNSMLDMVKMRMPIFGFKPLVKDKWESDKQLENIDVPILWLHGTEDRVIPHSEGLKLYNGYNGKKFEFTIVGDSHVDLWISGGRERITSFLKE